MKKISVVISLVLLAAFAGFCQTHSAASTSGFEVASIKPSDPGGGGMQIGVTPGGMFTGKNVTVKALIQQAYEIRDFQVSGGPAWLDTERYDIAAKGGGTGVSEDEIRKWTDEQRGALEAQFRLKVQMLLEDRFQLKVHRDTKELPVYVLIVGRNGPKITPASGDDVTRSALKMRRGDAGKSEITGTRVPLAKLIQTLSGLVGRTVLDHTGLKGNYDFKIVFTPDLELQSGSGDRPDPAPAIGTDGPSIFTALQEELGLRLEAQKGMVQVLVIDSAKKASEN